MRTAIFELRDHGFLLCVDSGGDDYDINRSNSGDAILRLMPKGHEQRLIAVGASGNVFGWIHFIYGSEGHDAICDYTLALDPYIPETLALAETLREQAHAAVR